MATSPDFLSPIKPKEKITNIITRSMSTNLSTNNMVLKPSVVNNGNGKDGQNIVNTTTSNVVGPNLNSNGNSNDDCATTIKAAVLAATTNNNTTTVTVAKHNILPNPVAPIKSVKFNDSENQFDGLPVSDDETDSISDGPDETAV